MTNATRCSPLLGLLLLVLALVAGAPSAAAARLTTPDDTLNTLTQMEHELADPSARAAMTRADWQRYGERLAETLASDHEGLRQGALRLMVLYGKKLELRREAIYDVVRIYRDHDNDRMRRMAVVALGSLDNAWGLDLLSRSVRFERTPTVRRTILAVLSSAFPPEGTVVVEPFRPAQ